MSRLFNYSLAAASLAVAAAAIAGVTLALNYTRVHTNERMATAYIASIDPLQGPHLASTDNTTRPPHHHPNFGNQ